MSAQTTGHRSGSASSVNQKNIPPVGDVPPEQQTAFFRVERVRIRTVALRPPGTKVVQPGLVVAEVVILVSPALARPMDADNALELTRREPVHDPLEVPREGQAIQRLLDPRPVPT
ncbi:hypothetical protein Ate02nite_67260 [Paractinoplanes tereljensis]|uniref:Uncharacterized protein n=1 Tax=Paractinoplanes tereljensis TaxID=571912 RepID=A0A919NU18_9ACTN|nr:hypothetical protein Ate02nite_67260 [Actinoplanes tereljensis]